MSAAEPTGSRLLMGAEKHSKGVPTTVNVSPGHLLIYIDLSIALSKSRV